MKKPFGPVGLTYRHGRGYVASLSVAASSPQLKCWRKALADIHVRPDRFVHVPDLRIQFPRRDFDIHHDGESWRVNVYRWGAARVALRSGPRRTLWDAVRAVVLLRTMEKHREKHRG